MTTSLSKKVKDDIWDLIDKKLSSEQFEKDSRKDKKTRKSELILEKE